MSRRMIAAFAFLWILSLAGVAVWAQSDRWAPVIRPGDQLGAVITGEEIGFQRIASEPTRDGKIVGKWMVKINGKWMETQAPVGIVRSR